MDGIEIPTHFLCPISLQLIRDPVTISTGITCDRDSIEQWLFSCKNKTCPVTKQTLKDTDLTQNHTLRRFIQAWCTLNASHGIERIPTPKPPVEKTQIAKLINEARKLPEMRLNCLATLRSIMLEGERNRSCLETSGAVEFFVSIINSCDSTLLKVETDEGSDFITASDEALSILYHVKVSGSCLKSIISIDLVFVESLSRVLENGNHKSREYGAVILKDIFEVADPIQLINVTSEFLSQLVRALSDDISQQATKTTLKLLAELCPWGRNKIKAVKGGAVFVLIELLLGTSERTASELSLFVLCHLCGCAEGRAELLKHGAGLAILSKKIFTVSHAASVTAVRIISSICKFSATSRVLQEMLQVGVVNKLILVVQLDCNNKSNQKAREILRLHSRVWRNPSCIPSYPS
ncbi:serine/threonine-protein phosphatase BSL3-like [Hibiscus syriacus]|uniref:U-box domain-containing protein n=1 Tax=Hibiscus syriacus TaxID=106335 RepID=A0A6A3D4L3_HIBSY|nr:E3 ubiquitin-protein ligase PUB23-like [Hibiscus syriacus]KAE8734818.1 serine/threonine-protein phosphatase BSL3-like [Hibiscus syriacus]